MPVIPALRRYRQRQEDCEATLAYIVRPCLKTKQNKTKQKTQTAIKNRKIVTLECEVQREFDRIPSVPLNEPVCHK
jgi:hypothetical protein